MTCCEQEILKVIVVAQFLWLLFPHFDSGYLDDFLKSKGLLDNSQALLYFSRASMDAQAIDGITSENPEGLTAATGIHAQAFADRLAALGLKCKVVSPEQYRPAMFEKLM